ncbi:hypothetical protein [Mesorhizobium sp.]|uniref:hypothetical protein n=1 Tax=Mesorhizobium sp. TaxID=1871066 RepID=UPI0025BE45B7|nr:hypothetical protein [Mesorhizobium sp.]
MATFPRLDVSDLPGVERPVANGPDLAGRIVMVFPSGTRLPIDGIVDPTALRIILTELTRRSRWCRPTGFTCAAARPTCAAGSSPDDGSQGFDIERSTLARSAGYAAALLDPIYNRIRETGRTRTKIHIPASDPGAQHRQDAQGRALRRAKRCRSRWLPDERDR